MQLGLATFADIGPDVTPQTRMAQVLEEAELADQLGLDVFAIGEHHRPDFLVSSPAVVLGAIAARTEQIRLASAVTVLSSDDPVRVFQQFAHVDLLSGGRAEIWAGRGSFIESFPLFGYDLDDYDELYAEKLELLLELRDHNHVTWSGRHRAPLNDAGVWPRPVQDPLPIWVAVGGTPQSVVRAAALGLPLTLAIIGGEPERFVAAGRSLPPGLGAQRARSRRRAGGDQHPRVRRRDIRQGRLGVRFLLPADDEPDRARARLAAGRPRRSTRRCAPRAARWPSARPSRWPRRSCSNTSCSATSATSAQMSVGAVAHADVMRSIELFGTEVAPVVRAEVARRNREPANAGGAHPPARRPTLIRSARQRERDQRKPTANLFPTRVPV